MARPSAVILNDTSTRYHHGCARVMANLVQGLRDQGFTISARIPARQNWAGNEATLAALRQAQVIVINGEGTLHDGAKAGERLLSVVDHPARGKTDVVLVNALYENNPTSWSSWIAAMALVAARDSRSAGELTRARGQHVRWLSDLSLAAPYHHGPSQRQGIIVGDSVRLERRQALARAAQRLGATYLPTKTLSGGIWHYGMARKLLWRGYNQVWSGSVPRFEMATDTDDYLARLARAEGHLTGRFHAVCLSMLTSTPFLAVTSNTSKIETLLADSGLTRDRVLTDDALQRVSAAEICHPFNTSEQSAITATIERAANDAQQLFRDIRALV